MVNSLYRTTDGRCLQNKLLSVAFVLIMVSSAIISCNQIPPEINLQDAIELANTNTDTLDLLVCDFRVFNKIKKRREWRFALKRDIPNHMYYYVDISLPDNRDAQYILTLDKLPTVLSFNADGDVFKIENSSGIHYLDSISRLSYSNLLRGYCCLQKRQVDSNMCCHFEFELDSIYGHNFYAHTLIARKFDKEKDSLLAEPYWSKAIELFEDSPDSITEPLYLRSLRRLRDTLSHVTFFPQVIEIPSKQEYHFNIYVSNYGQRNYYLYDVRPSCSCVRVKHPYCIRAEQTDTLFCSHIPTSSQEAREYRIYINTATRGHNPYITIKTIDNEEN